MVESSTGRASRALRPLAALLVGGLVLAGCEGEELRPLEPEGGQMFRSYVAMGNSITAGFQSGGINDSTQRASYAAMVAGAMGTEFNLPLLASPGCPPPLVNVYEGTRVAGSAAGDAATPSALTTFVLGGRTQVQAAREAEPTFVSVMLGSNDVLEAGISGDTASITPPSTFADRYTEVLDGVAAAEPEGGVLIGVPDVTLIPYLSPGAAYYQAYQQGAFPPTFTVDDSCSPTQLGQATLVPFGYAFGELLRRAAAGESVELNCAADPPVLLPAEIQTIRQTVVAYNGAIEQEASDRGWAYVNPNDALEQVQDRVPVFPNTSGADAVERPFGDLFSKDGIHPARPLQRMLATLVVEAVNGQYDTDLAPPGS